MSRKALLIVDHDSNATRQVRADLMTIANQRIEAAHPSDAIIRLRIHEFDSVLLCGSLSASERSELWTQISQQAVPPRVVCIGGSDAHRPYSHHTIYQPVRLPSMPDPATLAKMLSLQPSETSSQSSPVEMSLRLIGKSEAVLDIRRMIERFSETRDPVLIMGEVGTGRRLIGRQIHDASEPRDAPFVSVDCSALSPAAALESLPGGTDSACLFSAKLDQACGGTLLLDNIAGLPEDAQEELATILADKQYMQPGQAAPQSLGTRIVATSSNLLLQTVRQGQFSRRLYHELEGFPISVPPLRERMEDVPLMVAHLTCAMRHRYAADIQFSGPAMACLMRYHWPGNQTEMLTLLKSFAAMQKSALLDVADLPASIRSCAKIRRLQDLPKAQHPSPAANGESPSPAKDGRTAPRGAGRGDQTRLIRQYSLNREGNTAKIAG